MPEQLELWRTEVIQEGLWDEYKTRWYTPPCPKCAHLIETMGLRPDWCAWCGTSEPGEEQP